jgi:subtilisin family serine protease
METKEYIVITIRGVDIADIDAEMTASVGSETIPNRSCDVCNSRPLSKRQTHYHLTDAEAEALRNDPRILAVEIPPDQRDDIEISLHAVQSSNFTKTTSDSGNFVNWGLKRCISETNNYGTSTTIDDLFSYSADGTGVDVVISDSGLQVDHPEFTDVDGNSRVQLINWYTESGLSGTQSVNHYRDFDGHGTHCGGIAVGKTYGWAKNARIYALKVNGLEGTGDTGTGISITDVFDVIKGWHQNKPVDPLTGYKTPTVVNMSWGYVNTFSSITGGVYRGTPWTGTGMRTDYGMIGSSNGVLNGRHGVRVPSVDVDMEELIDMGVHVCISAGNYYQKIDVLGGLDYDNYYTKTGVGNVYYHRGASPTEPRAFVVGNIDDTVFNATTEQKAISSESGPGVDIWAPGTDIMSCTSTTNKWGSGSQNYYLNSNYRQTNISGTSMAAPQIAGVAACYLQINPQMTPVQLKAKIIADSIQDVVYTTGLNNDYTNNRSIEGGNNIFLYNKYNQSVVGNISGPLSASTLLKNKQ